MIEIPPRMPRPAVVGFLRPLFAFRGEDFHLRAARGANRFAYGGFDGLARRAVDRRFPHRQANTFAGDGTHTFTAAQNNLVILGERHAGKDQHAVGGIHIIAAIFANGGNRLLAFNVRRFHVQMQGDAGGGDNRDLVNKVLAQHHQRRNFCRCGGAGTGGIAFAQGFPVVPHRGVEGLAHCAACK